MPSNLRPRPALTDPGGLLFVARKLLPALPAHTLCTDRLLLLPCVTQCGQAAARASAEPGGAAAGAGVAGAAGAAGGQRAARGGPGQSAGAAQRHRQGGIRAACTTVSARHARDMARISGRGEPGVGLRLERLLARKGCLVGIRHTGVQQQQQEPVVVDSFCNHKGLAGLAHVAPSWMHD